MLTVSWSFHQASHSLLSQRSTISGLLNSQWRHKIRKKVKVAQSCPTLCDPLDYTFHVILQARILEWVAFPFSKGSSQPRMEPRSPALQVDSLPAEPQGKPKNTGESSLSLLQGIFPTQESTGVPCIAGRFFTNF